jgi:hypothetical protein
VSIGALALFKHRGPSLRIVVRDRGVGARAHGRDDVDLSDGQ